MNQLWSRMSRYGRDAVYLLPALLLILAQIRVVLGRFDRTVLGTLEGSDAVLQSGILAWMVRHWWDPATCVKLPVFFPSQNSLVGMDSLLGQALLVSPLHYLMNPSPALLYNVAVILTLLLTVLAGAALWLATCPEGTRAQRLAGAGFCGLVLLGAPFTSWQLGMLNQISPPWVVFMLAALWRGWRCFDTRRSAGPWWWLAVVCLVVQAAWGWYGFADAVFVLAVAGVFGLVQAARRRRLQRFLTQLALPALAAAVLVLALAWPYLQLRATTPEYTRELDAVQHFGSHLHVLTNLGPHRLAPADLLGGGAPSAERALLNIDAVLHPGWLTLLCALVGVWRWRGLRGFGLLVAAIGAVGFVMSFGDSGGYPPGSDRRIMLPFGWLREVLMPFKAFRCPSRFIFLLTVAMAWWATAGLHGMVSRSWPWRRALVIMVWALVWLESVPMAMLAVPIPVDGRPQHGSSSTVLAGGVLSLPAPAGEADERVTDAYWLHRALATGRPTTDGMSGWVPPVARRLRLRLVDCEQGRLAVPVLLDSLRDEGIVAAEVAEIYEDTLRVAFWREALETAGYRGVVRAPGYRWYDLQPAAVEEPPDSGTP